MPFGTPRQVVPKSGCKGSLLPMLAIRLAEFESSGAFEMSWFHGLSGGKSCLPCRLAPGPRAGACAPIEVTVRGRVAAGVGFRLQLNVASRACAARLLSLLPDTSTKAIRESDPTNVKTRKRIRHFSGIRVSIFSIKCLVSKLLNDSYALFPFGDTKSQLECLGCGASC